MIFIYIGIFLASLFVIVKAGSLLVRSLGIISRFFKLSEYIVSFILMALITSLPELFIGITSSLSRMPAISLGNIIGANILILTLGIGLVVIITKKIDVKTETVKKEAWNIFFLALLPVFLALDGILSTTDGIILLLFFFWYTFRLFSQRERFTTTLNTLETGIGGLKFIFKQIGTLVLGALLLIGAAWALVYSSSFIAEELNLSLVFIGLILVALGTTLPEISFGIRANLLKHPSMTLGNFVGSIAFNSLFVLGIVSIIYPIRIDNLSNFLVGAAFLALTLIVFNIFIHTKKRLSYREGIVLILIYVAFLVTEIFII